MKTITAFYKCRCMPAEVAIELPERGRDQDIADWMENQVKPAVSQHHRNRSPRCMATAMEVLKLPAPEGRPIGTSRKSMN